MTTIPQDNTPRKQCSRCHVSFPATLSYFHKAPLRPDGLYCQCKQCQNMAAKESRERRKNPTPNGYKQCSRCHRQLPATNEHFRSRGENPLKLKGPCIPCSREAALLWDKQNRPRKWHHAKPDAKTKVCSKCKAEKPLSAFSIEKHGVLKRSSRCKVCINPLKPKNYVQKPLPLIKKCNKCRKEKNIEEFYIDRNICNGFSQLCKACSLEDTHQRRATYLEALNAGKILPLPNRVPAMMRLSEYSARSRAIAAGCHCAEKVDYVHIYRENKDYPCYICGQDILRSHKISFDHVIPLVRGGEHSEENVRLTHFECNLRKNSRLLSEMTPYQRRGM